MKQIIIILLILVPLFGQEIGARYLIISHDNFYNAVEPLAQWKHKKGMRTKHVPLSLVGSTSTAIRNYIVNAYNTWSIRPEYLLLVGAPNYIPFPQVSNEYSDNFYTNITGDLYNEILSGRITCHTLTEAQTVVNKILAYERTPNTIDTTWFMKSCLIVNTDGDPYDDSIYWSDAHHAAGYMAANGFINIDTLSDIYGHGVTQVINSVNNGRAFVMYRGSGVNNWYAPFGVDPDQTANGTKLPIVLSITCRTIGTGSTSAIAEKWLLTGTPTTARGGAGYFATTTTVTNQAYLRSAVAKGFMDELFVNNARTFGQACEGGRKRVYQMYPSLGGDDEYYGFTTLGDPEMNFWTAVPRQISVNHAASVNIGIDTVIAHVEYNSTPVESAVVCIVLDTVVYATKYTNSNGDAVFIENYSVPGNMSITVTGQNLIPYEGIIAVISGNAFVAHESHSIEDSLGNNDGIVNNGETILLSISLKNMGTITAPGVSAILRANDSMLAVIDSFSYFGDIAYNTIAVGINPYVFSVSPASPSHNVQFELAIKDINNNNWTDNFTIQISGSGGSGGETGPDAYGYYIYDNTDTTTGNAPTYSWFEIAPPAGGPGIIIPQITNDDNDTITINLPFTFRYYGVNYNSIGICTNGFMELGNATSIAPTNTNIPSVGGPRRMLAPFWDDLNPGTMHMGHGDIYYHYDSPNHRWVLEFYQVAHRGMGGGGQWETFQLILQDPVYYPTPTNDGEAIYQYYAVANSHYNTVGIEDNTETRGLQYLYNDSYDPHAAVITSGRALLITTKPPFVAGVSPWLYLTNLIVDDSTSGNNNGLIDPGETVYLKLTLTNNGDTIALGTSGILRIVDPDASVIDSSSLFGDIIVNGSANNHSDPHAINIAASPVDNMFGALVKLSANSNNYISYIYFTLFISQTPGTYENKKARGICTNLKFTPNPVKNSVAIDFNVRDNQHPTLLEIFDAAGRHVLTLINEKLPAGQYTVVWDGTSQRGMGLPGGVYFIRLQNAGESITEKAILLKK